MTIIVIYALLMGPVMCLSARVFRLMRVQTMCACATSASTATVSSHTHTHARTIENNRLRVRVWCVYAVSLCVFQVQVQHAWCVHQPNRNVRKTENTHTHSHAHRIVRWCMLLCVCVHFLCANVCLRSCLCARGEFFTHTHTQTEHFDILDARKTQYRNARARRRDSGPPLPTTATTTTKRLRAELRARVRAYSLIKTQYATRLRRVSMANLTTDRPVLLVRMWVNHLGRLHESGR